MKHLMYRIVGFLVNIWALVAPRRAAQQLYRWFTNPPKPVLRPKELEFLSTARQINSLHAGTAVVEYHWGPESGPLVLLSYGWGYNAGRWRHYVPALVDAGFHVLAYDPPGHGLNKGPRTLNLAINSNIQRSLMDTYGPAIAVLAHSFGGSSAVLSLYNQTPLQRPLRMVLMASFSRAPRIFASYRRLLGLWTATYQGMLRYVEEKAGQPIYAFDMARMSAELGNVAALIVHDPAEKVTPFANALRYQAYWPGSALLRTPGAGHHLGKASVTEDILRFLIDGILPHDAETNAHPLPANHDLVRFFAGMEV